MDPYLIILLTNGMAAKTTKADLVAALIAITEQPTLFSPEEAAKEMLRIAKGALNGEWAGVVPKRNTLSVSNTMAGGCAPEP